MARLIYFAIASLDGYVEDAAGNFDWSAPDDEVHAFVNDLVRPIGTYLYGRRMYETMAIWESPGILADEEPASLDFAQIWRAADKIVISTTLESATTTRTLVEPTFDPDAIRQRKAIATRDIAVGGANLAAQALRAALVDELRLIIAPIVVGGGKRWLPSDVPLELALLDERRFQNGTCYLSYRIETRRRARTGRVPGKEQNIERVLPVDGD
jgi:dihydrofolate reductase